MIPYIKSPVPIYVYPHAEEYIGTAHLDRFKAVVNIFRHSIEQNRKLSTARDWMEKISYSLAMCGTDMASAKASIVVSCPSGNDKMVRQVMIVLSKEHILDQYAHGHTEVSYQLYIWREAFKYVGGTGDFVDIHFNSGYSLCGSPVTDVSEGVRLSTVACIIRIESEFFALTSAHPFESEEEPQDDPETPEDTESNPIIFGGVEYDFTETPSPQSRPTRSINAKHSSHTFEYKQRLFRRPVISSSLSTLKCVPGQPNLDWSLLKLQDAKNVELNSVQIMGPQQVEKTYYIDTEPRTRPSKQRHVRIITSHHTESKGTISPIPTYISNQRDNHDLCEVWTVSLTYGRGLEIGDSGSLVVDEETYEAYGHVIAVDPMGRIFVIPLVNTLSQIQGLFGTMDVDLFSKDWIMLPSRPFIPPNPYDSTGWHKLGG
ncbi:hypothetical protein F4813DRAFT_362428 [Daldinia decipiens]|uniref:uncharacterized protein n=1 Tax=Daldinia decipiens TaxID=326647 RepID=UPI0020C3C494|nr:uncharacterized protein F4813DRAFT_362428 [Daldinia decipiens]KAI1656948.1 hypothetical protein F4813DRAFT_362428 [Daldinia decipiens]